MQKHRIPRIPTHCGYTPEPRVTRADKQRGRIGFGKQPNGGTARNKRIRATAGRSVSQVRQDRALMYEAQLRAIIMRKLKKNEAPTVGLLSELKCAARRAGQGALLRAKRRAGVA